MYATDGVKYLKENGGIAARGSTLMARFILQRMAIYRLLKADL